MCPQAHIICPQGHTSLGEADIICPQGKHHSKKIAAAKATAFFWQVEPI
jgi:hypothetical protein